MPVTHADGPRGHSLPGQAQGGRLVGLVVDLQAAHARTAQRPGLEPRPPQAWVRAGGPGTLVLAALQSLEALPTKACLPICLLVSGRDGGTSAWRRGL